MIKTIVLFQPNVSPGCYNLKLQANEIKNLKTAQPKSISKPPHAIRFNLLEILPMAISLCVSLTKIRDTVPLT